MQTAVATLLLVISAAVFACVVVEYTISIFEQTLQPSNLPYADRIRKIEGFVLNQTKILFNRTQQETTLLLPP